VDVHPAIDVFRYVTEFLETTLGSYEIFEK